MTTVQRIVCVRCDAEIGKWFASKPVAAVSHGCCATCRLSQARALEEQNAAAAA